MVALGRTWQEFLKQLKCIIVARDLNRIGQRQNILLIVLLSDETFLQHGEACLVPGKPLRPNGL